MYNEFEKIMDLRKDFMKDPRTNIKKYIKDAKNTLPPPFCNSNRALLILFQSHHREFFNLYLALFKNQKITSLAILDDAYALNSMQSIQETTQGVLEYMSNKDRMTSIHLTRIFVSSIENIFKEVRNIINKAGYNIGNHFMSMPVLIQKINELEKKENVPLTNIKNVLNTPFRNSVSHEDFLFVPPDIISFRSSKTGISVEIARLSTDNIEKSLKENLVILSGIQKAKSDFLARVYESLLVLSDEDLFEIFKTGKLSNEQKQKVIFS
ncbi:MAG: hypothetical protein Q8O89_06165 [Nanoarchaeota archaeon]|nr:hypothetical protein [Nanoarchaeota archaeon]